MPLHFAYVVRPETLTQLRQLVSDALVSGDFAALRYFRVEREAAHARLTDSAAVALDPSRLADALADIRTVVGTSFASLPGAGALLEAADNVGLTARSVSALAYDRLLDRSENLASLVQLDAPPFIVEKMLAGTFDALTALDRFDLLAASNLDDILGEAAHPFLVGSCIRAARLPGSRESCIATEKEDELFLHGAPLFPRPQGAPEIAAWERLFGDPLLVQQPQVVESVKELEAGVATLRAQLREVGSAPEDKSVGSRRRRYDLNAYLDVTALAAEERMPMIEWLHVEPPDDLP